MIVARDVAARRVLRDVQLLDAALAQNGVVHLLALCAFSAPAQPLRARIERLFVQRPSAIRAEDLESLAERGALTDAVRENRDPPLLEEGFVRVEGTADGDRVEALLAEIATAPLGSVLPWLLCAELLGTSIRYGGSASTALEPYRASLLCRFAALAEQSPKAFCGWLERGRDAAADDALRVGLDALRAAGTLASLVRS